MYEDSVQTITTTITATTTTTTTTTRTTTTETTKPKHDPMACFKYEIGNISTLEDISEVNPVKGKSIFFHETSCKSRQYERIYLNARQACAVESAARQNPTFDVYLLVAAPAIIKIGNERSDHLIESLLRYKNIHIKSMNLKKYLSDTIVSNLYTSGQFEQSDFSMEHVSDVLRYVTLWKYGGIYLDTDMFVLQSLEHLPPNFTGMELDLVISAGIIGFDHQGVGHQWAEMCLQELRTDFRPKLWSYNSVGVLDRVLKKVCNTSKVAEMNETKCNGFKIYPRASFYPIGYYELNTFFKKELLNKGIENIKDAYTLHLWNKLTWNTEVKFHGNSSILEHVAQKYCPNVYQSSAGYF